ncbi:M10 family metallopeptidase C-terminal domain-containing protein [Terricaulis silvestris]|uniref:Cyclolysin n=1 Tax=Terricaulis silvestris TaxID=2686094 RepID=A0A6I6MM37_9CAUL|nr:matrixin family metalloprotease [Terricaulis silvestris]QGZ95739.1 Cyclolysin [Terricaulis silvestris]
MYFNHRAQLLLGADLDLISRKLHPLDDAWGTVDPLRSLGVGETTRTPAPFGAGHRVSQRKLLDAFQVDGVGDDKDIPAGPLLLLTLDQQPGDTSTQAELTVDGPHVVSTIDAIGDFDFFSVELEAGQYYNIGQFLVVGGPSGVPLSDAYIELYNADGELIVTADGGGANTPSGLDALLTYQATYTGTYFINARAFDQDGTNGTGGDAVGDYEVFVQKIDYVADPYAYKPFYSPDSPLHSIDWGTQLDHTSRNPDGNNGTRDNGVPNTGTYVDPATGIVGKNVITYYFAKTGELFIDEDPTTPGSTDTMIAKGFEQWEKDAFRLALDQYEKVADIIYLEVDNRAEADFNFVTYPGTPGVGASLLGRMSPPDEENEGQAEFNAGDVRWTQEGLQQGGFYFPTLLHEFGHGHGMAHPHDNGGHSSIMRGAGGGTAGIGGGLGDFGLSQQVFTIMSYNDGWQTSPYGQSRSGGITGTEVDHFGWVGTLAALDIAVIQDKYGVNEEWAAGNDVYTLKDVNAAGTFYATIWDGGGTDEIRYDGAKNASIDLRAATLQYEEGGGGWVSYAYGIYGGYTIANGVTIENATGGAGADTLVGNDAANVLSGNDGDDVFLGNAGADTLNGGAGADTFFGGAGADRFNGGDGVDTVSYAEAASGVTAYISGKAGVGGEAQGDVASGVEVLVGSAHADKLYGDAVTNDLRGGDGADTVDGAAGNDRVDGGNGDDFVLGGAGDDFVIGGSGADRVNGGAGNDIADYSGSESGVVINLQSGATSGGHAQGDMLIGIEGLSGSAFGDTLYGNSTANTLNGGGGADILSGGAANDRFVFQAGQANGDIALDFAGAGEALGDAITFEGYGSAADGAHVTRIDLTHWQVTSADGLINDIITLANGATIDQSDYMFS